MSDHGTSMVDGRGVNRLVNFLKRSYIKMKIKNDPNHLNNKNLPFIIAEIGSNFNQDINQAKKLIDVSANAKVNAVKFQLFRAEELQSS